MYFGNYHRLVYLAQAGDATLDTLAAEAAARLGLAFARRFTGMGDLGAAMASVASMASSTVGPAGTSSDPAHGSR